MPLRIALACAGRFHAIVRKKPQEDIMKKLTTFLFAAAASSVVFGAAAAAQPASVVERLDPALDALVAPGTKVEIIHREDQFFEGPIWHHGADGNFLTFSDLIQNRIDKWDPATKQVTTYLPNIWKGKDSANAIQQERNGKNYIQVGPNGQTIDGEGRLVFCAMGSGEIRRQEKDGKITVLASQYQGHHLNAPNDLVIKSNGDIYFTDIRSNTKSSDFNPPEGVAHTGVYRIKDGKLDLLIDNLEAPNGIAFSPDEKLLYVNDIRSKKVMRYDVKADGTLTNAKVFIDMNSDKRPGNPDGMKVDAKGNVWDTGPGGIWIVSPEGKHLGTILTPERLSNLAWGDADGMTLYGTSQPMVVRIRVKAAGFRP
jgi:gluconolactonase